MPFTRYDNWGGPCEPDPDGRFVLWDDVKQYLELDGMCVGDKVQVRDSEDGLWRNATLTAIWPNVPLRFRAILDSSTSRYQVGFCHCRPRTEPQYREPGPGDEGKMVEVRVSESDPFHRREFVFHDQKQRVFVCRTPDSRGYIRWNFARIPVEKED